jgi:hypothetical protein
VCLIAVNQSGAESLTVGERDDDPTCRSVEQVRTRQHEANRLIDGDQRAAARAAVGDRYAAMGCRVKSRESRVKSQSATAGN